jgi:hypothetical protein
LNEVGDPEGGATVRRSFLYLGVLLTIVAFVRPLCAFDLAADIKTKDGTHVQTGRLYVKGDKYRVDVDDASEYAIIRHDKNKSWIVFPNQKTYIEMPFNPKRRPAIEESHSRDGNRRFLGTEAIDGRATRKYEVMAEGGGAPSIFHQWIAADSDFPIKTTDLNGAWSIEYYNIKASVPDAVFEIPEAYEKIAMPAVIK